MTTTTKIFSLCEALVDSAEFLADDELCENDLCCDSRGKAEITLPQGQLDLVCQAMEELDVPFWLDEQPKVNPNSRYRLWVSCTDHLFGGRDLFWGLRKIED